MATNIQTNSQTISKVKVWIFSCKSDVEKIFNMLRGSCRVKKNPRTTRIGQTPTTHPPIHFIKKMKHVQTLKKSRIFSNSTRPLSQCTWQENCDGLSTGLNTVWCGLQITI